MFTLPAQIAATAFTNKALVYDLMFKAVAETMLTIAADPQNLGARIGVTAVLHSWGSAMTHHPHVHMIVPGGDNAQDGRRWICSRPAFLLPVRVLGAVPTTVPDPADRAPQCRQTRVLRQPGWDRRPACLPAPSLAGPEEALGGLCKAPFAGPEAVLAYLSRYTHRVAISTAG